TVPGIEREITISIGVAIIPDHAGDADGLMREVDRALYAAKEHGRNRVEVAVPSEAAAARRAAVGSRVDRSASAAAPTSAPGA
ncbi:MAG: diguanylate cyclase, partial [Actinobacteria bacterium]|nr:diguanylate cyclase [Actinomycetota bacterium]